MNSFIVFTFFVSTCIAVSVAGHGHHEEHDGGPAYYKFGYAVHDPHTGDKKEQHEVRDGHVVKGSYSLKEADGTTRIVEYVAGPHTGFNAVVKRIGHAYHPQHYGHHGGAASGHGASGYGGHGGHGASSSVGVTHFGYHY